MRAPRLGGRRAHYLTWREVAGGGRAGAAIRVVHCANNNNNNHRAVLATQCVARAARRFTVNEGVKFTLRHVRHARINASGGAAAPQEASHNGVLCITGRGAFRVRPRRRMGVGQVLRPLSLREARFSTAPHVRGMDGQRVVPTRIYSTA